MNIPWCGYSNVIEFALSNEPMIALCQYEFESEHRRHISEYRRAYIRFDKCTKCGHLATTTTYENKSDGQWDISPLSL